jgi:hypothetical protein
MHQLANPEPNRNPIGVEKQLTEANTSRTTGLPEIATSIRFMRGGTKLFNMLSGARSATARRSDAPPSVDPIVRAETQCPHAAGLNVEVVCACVG